MKKQNTIAEIQVSYHPDNGHKPTIKSSQDAYNHIKEFFSSDTIALQEQFVVAYLNRANKIIGVYQVSKGGITGTVADPRLIISVALKVAATAMILAHNHPSGNLSPSKADEDITKKIKDGGEMFDIKMLDHLILVPGENYLSFTDQGLI